MSKPQIYRATWHDYKSRCIYMVTITKNDEVPMFGILSGTPDCPQIILSELGKIIRNAVFTLPRREPSVKVLQYIIMPDHVHILLHVHTVMNGPLGDVIARLKREISKNYHDTSVFCKGYNDQILKPSRSLDVLYKYIRDNPRRLAVRRFFPDFFRKINCMKIGDIVCQAYGNLHLMDNPF